MLSVFKEHLSLTKFDKSVRNITLFFEVYVSLTLHLFWRGFFHHKWSRHMAWRYVCDVLTETKTMLWRICCVKIVTNIVLNILRVLSSKRTDNFLGFLACLPWNRVHSMSFFEKNWPKTVIINFHLTLRSFENWDEKYRLRSKTTKRQN